jgi:hypothetical protein
MNAFPAVKGENEKNISVLINSIEHALATAANDVGKTVKFVGTSVPPVLKKAQVEASTIESVTALVSPQAANEPDSRCLAWSSTPSTRPALRLA